MPDMQKNLWVTVFVSEIKSVENYPDFYPDLQLKISKVSQRRQTILVIFCRSGSVA